MATSMMYVHTMGRAVRNYARQPAFSWDGVRLTFAELHERVAHLAAALSAQGFAKGDRLALLLPNEREYLELVYACAWLGVIAVPLNARYAPAEIDRVLADANPHGLIRDSSLPAPTVTPPWQRVLDQEP